MDSGERKLPPRSASPTTRSSRWGTSCSSRLPRWARNSPPGKTFGTVESVKAVSDLFAPASGTVTEVNADLATSPEKVNKDAHGSWMVKLTLKNPSELDGLLSAADYEKFVAEEAGH